MKARPVNILSPDPDNFIFAQTTTQMNSIDKKRKEVTSHLFKTNHAQNAQKSLFRNVSLTLRNDEEIRKKLLRSVFRIRVYQLIFINIMNKILKQVKTYGVSKIIFDVNFRSAESIRNNLYYLSQFNNRKGAGSCLLITVEIELVKQKTQSKEMRHNITSTGEIKKPIMVRKRRFKLPLIKHNSSFIFIWNIISVFFFLYYITLMPFFIAFDESSLTILILEQVMDIFFILDLFLNFNVIVKKGDQFLTSRRAIAKNYLKTFFFLDVVTSIPFSFILDFSKNNFSGVNKLLRLYKLPKLFAAIIKTNFFNLINFLKIFKFKEFYRYQIRAKGPLFRTIYVTIMTFLLMHIGACIFIFLGKNKIFHNGSSWLDFLEASESSVLEVYTTAIYYCFVVLTTVGYGDIVSRSNFEIVFTLIWMIGGIAFYSFTISMITLFFTSKHNRKTLLEKKIISFEKYVNENKLPSQLRDEIKKFLEYVSHKISYRWDERRRNVIENLPLELKYHFFTEVHREIMLECPFFRTLDINFKVKIMSLMKPLFVKKGNYIWRKNDPSNIIIFIEKGNVDLTINNVFLDHPLNRRRCSITALNTPSKSNFSKRLVGHISATSHFSMADSKSNNSIAELKHLARTHRQSFWRRLCCSLKRVFLCVFCCSWRKSKVSPSEKPSDIGKTPIINISSIRDNLVKKNTLISSKYDNATMNKSGFDKYITKETTKKRHSFQFDSNITNGRLIIARKNFVLIVINLLMAIYNLQTR